MTYTEQDEEWLEKSDIDLWLINSTTHKFRKQLLEKFDHQEWLLSSSISAEQLKGRAEVLAFILDPKQILED